MPSSPPPEAPSSPPPLEVSLSSPQPNTQVEDIEEKNEPLVSFDDETSSEVLLMLPEDTESELQQMMEDTSRRIDKMETEPAADDQIVTGDLLGFDPFPATDAQPNILAERCDDTTDISDVTELPKTVETDDLLNLGED